MRSTRQLIAYGLIALGALTLLSRIGPGTGWLWAALAAVGFLAAYRQERIYPFLVVGGLLAGMAAGLLLEGAWGWRGAFLVSLGTGFLLIDRVEPRQSRWPIYPAAVLIGVGIAYWLFRAGFVQSLWFPLLLIIAGLYLLRSRDVGAWMEVDEPLTEGSEREAPLDPDAVDQEGASSGALMQSPRAAPHPDGIEGAEDLSRTDGQNDGLDDPDRPAES